MYGHIYGQENQGFNQYKPQSSSSNNSNNTTHKRPPIPFSTASVAESIASGQQFLVSSKKMMEKLKS